MKKSLNKIKENAAGGDGDGGSDGEGEGDESEGDDPDDGSLWEDFETIICSVIFILLYGLVNMVFY